MTQPTINLTNAMQDNFKSTPIITTGIHEMSSQTQTYKARHVENEYASYKLEFRSFLCHISNTFNSNMHPVHYKNIFLPTT